MTEPRIDTAVVSEFQPTAAQLAVVLRREAGGPELARVRAGEAWITDMLSEMWRDFFLRRGSPDIALADIKPRVTPTFSERAGPGSRCNGFVVSSQALRTGSHQRTHSIDALADLASIAAQKLIAEGALNLVDNYFYEVVADASPAQPRQPDPSFRMTARRQPLRYDRALLRPLLEQAEPVGQLVEGQFPVFYTRRALQDAEQFARRGADRQPPRETGCALVGPLCSCPATGELFVVVSAALEARDAEEREHSLSYTPKTWGQLQVIVNAMQAQQPMHAHRILGQAHGHNFLPLGGAPPCELCHTSKVCGRTSVFVSTDDRIWTQAVFSQQPWAICHIFGLNARNEKVQALYSLRDNRLQERGYYVIDDITAVSP